MMRYITSDAEKDLRTLYRRLHEIPEVGFDLPKTVELVKQELKTMGICYTERYGKSSIVADIAANKPGPAVALRADMDALPITETAAVPFRSKHPGSMHACGHDAHTAMLLSAARVLKSMETELPFPVRLIFQPSEEGAVSGAKMMVENSVTEGVRHILCLHVENALDSGCIGIRTGEYMAACHPYSIVFHGKSAHATLPGQAKDALAMAVKAYNDICAYKAGEWSALPKHILSLSSIQAGDAHNVIPGEAKLLLSFRFYDMLTHDLIDSGIRAICEAAAKAYGGTVAFSDGISCPAVCNDPAVASLAQKAAEKTVGAEHVRQVPQKLSSEDFSHYLTKVPGALIRIGTRNEAKGCVEMTHNSGFMIDEDALKNGSELLVRFVLECGELG